MEQLIILGLGCNLGDCAGNLRKAVGMIKADLLDNVVESRIIHTPPMLPENAPDDWHIEFSNIVICGTLKTPTSPEEFLAKIKQFETALGRTPSARWAPRMMDIDILAWGDLVYESPTLTIPHKGILDREFVTIPLAEILPGWVHPKLVGQLDS